MRTLPAWLTALLLSCAACGGSSTSSGLGHHAIAGGPAGPAPTIAWSGGAPVDGGGSFDTTGLPAVADDGSRVVVGWQMGDGGRGYPNLRLVVVDRADRTVDTRVVLDADKIEDDTPAVDVTADNQYLADSNQAARWRPLAAAAVAGEPEGDEMYATRQTATLGDLGVQFDDTAHLVITQGGKVVFDRVMKDWLQLARPMYPGAGEDETCSNPIFLSSAYLDGARRLAVIGFDYHGDDTCWEPTGEYHVVAW